MKYEFITSIICRDCEGFCYDEETRRHYCSQKLCLWRDHKLLPQILEEE